MDAFGILLQKCWKSFGHWSAPRIRGSEMSLWTRSGTVCPPWHPSPVGNRSRGSAESGTYTTLPSRKVGNRLRVFREAAASPSVPDRGRGCGSGAVPPPPKPGTGAARGQRGLFLKLLDFALRQPEFLRQNSSPSSFLRVGGETTTQAGAPPTCAGKAAPGAGLGGPGGTTCRYRHPPEPPPRVATGQGSASPDPTRRGREKERRGPSQRRSRWGGKRRPQPLRERSVRGWGPETPQHPPVSLGSWVGKSLRRVGYAYVAGVGISLIFLLESSAFSFCCQWNGWNSAVQGGYAGFMCKWSYVPQ